MFNLGEVYSRTALHKVYGGQLHTRISTPAEYNMIFLFAWDNLEHNRSREGEAYLSGWTSYGIFRFVGEGRYGHMVFARGNRALRHHERTGKTVHLFVRLAEDDLDQVRYEGQFAYSGHFYKEGLDARHHLRRMIVFVLKPLG